jgi:hypothetical protein
MRSNAVVIMRSRSASQSQDEITTLCVSNIERYWTARGYEPPRLYEEYHSFHGISTWGLRSNMLDGYPRRRMKGGDDVTLNVNETTPFYIPPRSMPK